MADEFYRIVVCRRIEIFYRDTSIVGEQYTLVVRMDALDCLEESLERRGEGRRSSECLVWKVNNNVDSRSAMMDMPRYSIALTSRVYE